MFKNCVVREFFHFTLSLDVLYGDLYSDVLSCRSDVRYNLTLQPTGVSRWFSGIMTFHISLVRSFAHTYVRACMPACFRLFSSCFALLRSAITG